MVTLHSYVLRELLKTFGLALTALTVLFTMGGGLYNVVRFEGVSAGDIFGFLPMLVPIVVTLTMPMAALFAATSVYGRLAADNELVACRAAGINVHRLFASAVLLSVFVAAFTLLFGSFIIPGFFRRLDVFARNNVRDLVSQKLQYQGFIHRGRSDQNRYTITAENVQGVTDAALRARGFEVADGLQYLLISNPTFLNVDRNGELVRFIVARHVLCAFDARQPQVEVTLHLADGQDFEVGKRAIAIHQQQFGPIRLELPTTGKLSTASLSDLFTWRRALWDTPRLRNDVQSFLDDVTIYSFFRRCGEQLQAGQPVVLVDDDGQEHRITCAGAEIQRRGLSLTRARVEVRGGRDPSPIAYEAERTEIKAQVLPSQAAQSELGTSAGRSQHLQLEVRLLQTPDQDVLEYRSRAGGKDPPRRKPTLSLDLTVVPREMLANATQLTPAAVLDPEAELPLDERLADRRASLWKAARETARKIVATIHFRLGFTASVLVTLVMGAALGVIFRGARALAAFGLAMIPFFSVLILLVLGRQLTEVPDTTALGPYVTWTGLGLALLANGVILQLGVRR